MNKSIWTMSLFLLLAGACGHEHSHDNEVTGPETEPLVFTLYSDKTELFVEFLPLVVGSESRFATHLTLLGEYFKPLDEGPVSLQLIVNGQITEVTATDAEVPGIFRLRLTPKVAGKGKLIFKIASKSISDEVVIDNVTVYPDVKASLSHQHPAEAQGEISFLKEQAWKTEFANAVVVKQTIGDVIRTSGKIIAAPGDEISLVSNASGIIRFSGTGTTTGAAVKSGMKLFYVTGANLTENNIDIHFLEAKSNYEKAEADFRRAELLAVDKIISEKDLLQARNNYENSRTAYQAISKNYQSGKGVAIAAPADGYVNNIVVSDGQYVQAGTTLATISKNKKLRLIANISQKYFDKINTVKSARFSTGEGAVIYNTANLNGQILSFGKSISASTPFTPLTIEFDNPGSVIPGSVVEIYLLSEAGKESLAVPVNSLIEEQGVFYVFIQTGGESFQKREIKTGAGDGEFVQVLSGISEGERVVTKGAYQVKLAAASGSIPAHGHEH